MREKLISLREAAAILGVAPGRLRRRAQKGDIPGLQLFGRQWRFRPTAIEEWIDRQKPRGAGRREP